MLAVRNLFCIAGVVLTLMSTAVSAAKQVGSVSYVRGAVTKQAVRDGANAHLLIKGNELKEGDVIKTGSKSFALLKLADGTRLTIRPKSSFVVEQMNARKDSTASAILRLFRGGLRAVTGFISKKNPRGYRLRTAVATIGIRGTEFDARLCGKECAEENKKLNKKKNPARAVAKVIYKRGNLRAVGFDDKKRELKGASAIYEGDTLITGSKAYAVIAFRDRSRVSLQSNTQFRIDEMRFDKKKAEKSSSLFSLLKGGLRAITGLMGKFHPERYRMRTTIATIGIRGTGYDALCTGACSIDNSVPVDVDLPNGPGLYSTVWEGGITLDKYPVQLNQSVFKADKGRKPALLARTPDFFKNNPVPRPGSIKVDEDKLFQDTDSLAAPPGLYVGVEEGNVIVQPHNTNESEILGPEQAVFVNVDGSEIQALPSIPMFQQFDKYPKPDQFVDIGLRLGNSAGEGEEQDKVCEIR